MTEKIYIEQKGKLIGYDANISKDTRSIKGLNYHLVEHISTGFKYLISEEELNNIRKISTMVSKHINDIELSGDSVDSKHDAASKEKVESNSATDKGIIGVMQNHFETRLELIKNINGTCRSEQLNTVIGIMSEIGELCENILPTLKKEFDQIKNNKN